MKYTLLELTQEVLSSMDSDEVNSINDTVESQQVARIIRTAFFDIVARSGLPEHKMLFNLTASGDNDKPTLMTIPSDVRHMDWLKYNKEEDGEGPRFILLEYLEPFEFTNLMHMFDTSDTNVGSMIENIDGDNITFFYKDNKHPDYYTIYSDVYVIFDSYHAGEDTTLQNSKTLAYGEKTPFFELLDAFTPELDEKQFALLLNEAKKLSFAELKQTMHPVAADNARRQWVNLRKRGSVSVPYDYDKLPNYGRK